MSGPLLVVVGDTLLGRFLDRAFAKIGPVAEIVDFFFFFRCLRETIVDLFQQVRTPSKGRVGSFGRGPHMVLLILLMILGNFCEQ